MSCACSLKCFFAIRRIATAASLSCERLCFVRLSFNSTAQPIRNFCISSRKCSNTATTSQLPFDPDVHFTPPLSSNAERQSLHRKTPPVPTLPADWQNVPIVYTTGVAYRNDDGSSTAKIGVYWSDGDVLNRLKVVGAGSAIFAEIEAVILALKQAVYELHLSRVVVRTDSDYVCRCVAKYFTFWKQSDFYKANGDKVKYADELQELDRLLSTIEARVEYVSKTEPNVGNWILNKLRPIRLSEKQDIQWSAQSKSSLSAGDASVDPENSLVVYTCGAYRDTDLRGEPFTRAGVGAYWPHKPEDNVSRRLSMFPVTLFRSQLQAIVFALEQAIEAKCASVIVRTDSRVFLKYFLRQWKKADGNLVRNYPQYLRIIELASRLKVRFEYASEESEEREEALILAEDGMSQPMINEARRLLKRGVSDLAGSTIRSWKVVVDSKEGDWTGQASKSDRKRLIVRTSAVRLLKTVIEWIPQWRRNQWNNSLRKPIVNVDQWKYLDELMHNIEIKWEYSDSAETDDELRAVDTRAEGYLQKNFAKNKS
ncbi:unnamed protein product [Toxocara canis]|uniref:ribonuclease H n=1 Tax=Toxocara canis TaxID=6265 RepID=A0A183V836_TOXCA|nr:unnamed protein product [Toxocara canis]